MTPTFTQTFTDADFQERVVVDSHHIPVLVDFWAPWCGPCQSIKPYIDKLAFEYQGRMVIGSINTDDNKLTSQRYQITSIPALLLFHEGELIHRHEGSCPYTYLRKVFQEMAEKRLVSCCALPVRKKRPGSRLMRLPLMRRLVCNSRSCSQPEMPTK